MPYVLLTDNVVKQTQPNLDDGFLWSDGSPTYGQILENETIVDGVIISGDFVDPVNTPLPLTSLQIRNTALADITYTRPSDGAQIQIRHPDYASDYIIMTSAINMLAPLETRLWIVKDDQPTSVSREDLEAAIVFGSAEVDRIFVEYITALQGE
tara:strand:+ start:67 stop:528 length:462 start_codon:yes stop_codon:yes gene_type:complete